MDSLPGLPYSLETPQNQRVGLLTPYDWIVTVKGTIRIELGRFSFGLLPRVRIYGGDEPRCLLKIGAFCEAARDALILVGGEHRNESLLNYSFGGPCIGFRNLVDQEPATTTPSEIGDNVLISARAIILGGATIGTGAVIGAGVVARKADPYTVYGGRPRLRFTHERLALYNAMRLPDIMAADIPSLPRLVRELEAGRIGIDDYLATVSFLPARPTIHMSANYGPEGEIQTERITGFSLGGQMIDDPRLDAYFAQITGTEKLQWAPDIFAALGYY